MVDITLDLISHITSLPINVDLVPTTSKNPTLLEELIGSWTNKNLKEIMISQTTNITIKWESTIVSICLINLGQPSDIKK